MEPRCLGLISVSARLIDEICLLSTWRGYRYRKNYATADRQQDYTSIFTELPSTFREATQQGWIFRPKYA